MWKNVCEINQYHDQQLFITATWTCTRKRNMNVHQKKKKKEMERNLPSYHDGRFGVFPWSLIWCHTSLEEVFRNGKLYSVTGMSVEMLSGILACRWTRYSTGIYKVLILSPAKTGYVFINMLLVMIWDLHLAPPI